MVGLDRPLFPKGILPVDHAARIVDANANRAREGLRMMEDAARFALDDQSLAEQCKVARHRMRAAIGALPISEFDLLASRDTPGDVGTGITTALEQNRENGLASIVVAAAKRVGEALRVIEEVSKAIGADARVFETLRYTVYELEKRLVLRLAPPCPQWKLCVLVTEKLCTQFSCSELIKLAVEGGADCIQIREKAMTDSQLLEHCSRLVETCRGVGVDVIVNDHVGIARLANADGIHLGRGDLPTAAARQILGPARWIGRTCSSIDDALVAIENGADSCGLGPIFPSLTKPKPNHSGCELIRAFIAEPRTAHVPHLAISGITPDNVSELTDIGCRGVAVSAAVCGSEDPKSVCQKLVERLSAPTLRA